MTGDRSRHAGKIAIVTGAGQGIGRAIAERLARDGADVVVADINAEGAARAAEEIRAASGVHTRPARLDVSRPAEMRALVADVVAAWGRIDILVNNAGVNLTKPFSETTEEEWDRVIAVNQKGTFFCTQIAGEQMVRQIPEADRAAGGPPEGCRGWIVNMSSISGRRGRPLGTAYAASKAAIISITQSAALFFAPYNIHVNAVSPSVIPTPMWEVIDRERGKYSGMKPGEAMKSFVDTIPLKRAGKPEEIAAVVSFLCSADAEYMTGQTLNVDGGFEMG
jgi:meso-butanediol dehydrogenase / (S,S)-butanediol dehydrogenase / diacetyl reductase